ncbi:ferredoxin [Nocardia mangyaensis]|uniref:Ferredoxin n=1 Tax=Nocardia mangyaensis TaxID=2213200 RepID=A0A1J0VVZ4_9NOCA|nr:ferredoxin [Nocardia mangyaensis]APE36170.1 ferredoxin [Nocardia mangyaensis]
MRIVVDLDLCQGHGVCQDEAPAVFTVPKHGTVHIVDPTPGAAQREAVETAIRYCPTRALSITDGGEPDSAVKGTD